LLLLCSVVSYCLLLLLTGSVVQLKNERKLPFCCVKLLCFVSVLLSAARRRLSWGEALHFVFTILKPQKSAVNAFNFYQLKPSINPRYAGLVVVVIAHALNERLDINTNSHKLPFLTISKIY